MGGGICPCHEEAHELIDQLIDRVALNCIQQFLLLYRMEDCPFFLSAFFQLVLDDLLCHRFEDLYLSVDGPIFLE